MTFEEWLETHLDARTAFGDLARDVSQDEEWPEHSGRHEQAAHMERAGACLEAVATLHRAHFQYRTETRKVVLTPASEVDMAPSRRDWGPWRLDPVAYVLYPTGPYRYEVDLEDCLTAAQVLDWICQIAGKSWSDDATLAGLVRAIDDVLNPQSCLCSCGQSSTLSKSKIRSKVTRLAAEEVLR